MEIEDYGRARFLVTAHGDTFTVDLCCHGGNGACDCVHFLARIKPAIEEAKQRGDFSPGPAFRCPHLAFAREVMLNIFLAELVRRYPDDEPI